jgi:hypothetical protein
VVFLSILQHSAPAEFVRSLALVLLGGLGTSSITLGMGAAFPKLSWENPRQQTTFRAGCLTPILYVIYIAVALGTVLGLPALGVRWPEFAAALTALGWLLFVGATAVVVVAALSFGAARLERLELA